MGFILLSFRQSCNCHLYIILYNELAIGASQGLWENKLLCSVWECKEPHFSQGIYNNYFNLFAPCSFPQCLTVTCQCQSCLDRAASPVLPSLNSQKFWWSLAEIKVSLTDQFVSPGCIPVSKEEHCETLCPFGFITWIVHIYVGMLKTVFIYSSIYKTPFCIKWTLMFLFLYVLSS